MTLHGKGALRLALIAPFTVCASMQFPYRF